MPPSDVTPRNPRSTDPLHPQADPRPASGRPEYPAARINLGPKAKRPDAEEGSHRSWTRFLKAGGLLLPILIVLVVLAVAFAAVKLSGTTSAAVNPDAPAGESDSVELVTDKPNSLFVPDDVQTALGIRKDGVDRTEPAVLPKQGRTLEMPGSTALNPAGLVRVRVRFAPAEVVEIGKRDDPHASPGNPRKRELQAGDPVTTGDTLAVLYSVDLGNKKNDLFDALAQLRLDEKVLNLAEKFRADVPEVFLLNAQRNVQADINAVNRAENTLKTWAIDDREIQAVHEEVKNCASDPDRRTKESDQERKERLAKEEERRKKWARVELKAPETGFIIEQNCAVHETIVDNTTNLFQIAKVDPLIVLAAVPEDELPALQQLQDETQGHIPWKVRTVGTEPIPGLIDDIGYLIDPNQHTAVVRGHIANRDGRLRAGQFVTASVELPPPKNVVQVPIAALVEDGKDSIVFVQPDEQPNPKKGRVYTMRRVEVVSRFDDVAYVLSAPAARKGEERTEEGGPAPLPARPLRVGERVLVAGSLELKTALENKRSELASKLAEAAEPVEAK